MNSQKKNPVADSSGTQGSNESTNGPQSSAKSTHSEALRERITDALRRRPQSSYALRCLGCTIPTDRIALFDQDGYSHPRAALYTLVSEPEA